MCPLGTAFLLSFLAGAASAVGGLLSFVIKKENLTALAIGLGFSAGVMLYVSFAELLPHAKNALILLYGTGPGAWRTSAGPREARQVRKRKSAQTGKNLENCCRGINRHRARR